MNSSAFGVRKITEEGAKKDTMMVGRKTNMKMGFG